jgi:hypothetical protein
LVVVVYILNPVAKTRPLSWSYREILTECPPLFSHCRVQFQIATPHHF